jgi:thiol-disulfide isomerase/thioredoxin
MKRLLMVFAVIGTLMTGCIKEKRTGADLDAGDCLPEFSVIMNDGTVVSDADLYGNVSVIMFFHTSCKDCREVLPLMQKIYDEYAGKGVRFAFISRSEGNDEIMAYWEENSLKMPYSAQKDRGVYELFASERIPRIYINDKDGIIRYIHTDDPVPSYDDLKSEIGFLIR